MSAVQLSSAVIVLILLCAQVESSCWGETATPGEDMTFPTYCEYLGWTFESGSNFTSSAPSCERCTCMMGTLSCCGYGRRAGVFKVEGCTQVIDDNSCELMFVDSTNENLPCNP